jgi:hypothetical protein
MEFVATTVVLAEVEFPQVHLAMPVVRRFCLRVMLAGRALDQTTMVLAAAVEPEQLAMLELHRPVALVVWV